MLEVHTAAARGKTKGNGLDSLCSFSHGDYVDFERMGYSVLQTLNEQKVQAGNGFGERTHDNMEILCYVTKGILVHSDSLGKERIVPAGDFLLLTAGAGIKHSEANGSQDEDLHFIEMWIIPNQMDLRPGYQQRSIEPSSNFQLVASHVPGADAMFMNQNAEVYRFTLDQNRYFYLSRAADSHKAYLHLLKGRLKISDGADSVEIQAGDGLKCEDIQRLEFIKLDEEIAEGLLMVLPGEF